MIEPKVATVIGKTGQQRAAKVSVPPPERAAARRAAANTAAVQGIILLDPRELAIGGRNVGGHRMEHTRNG